MKFSDMQCHVLSSLKTLPHDLQGQRGSACTYLVCLGPARRPRSGMPCAACGGVQSQARWPPSSLWSSTASSCPPLSMPTASCMRSAMPFHSSVLQHALCQSCAGAFKISYSAWLPGLPVPWLEAKVAMHDIFGGCLPHEGGSADAGHSIPSIAILSWALYHSAIRPSQMPIANQAQQQQWVCATQHIAS